MKVLVAHPYRLFADVVAGTMSCEGGFEVVGTYTDHASIIAGMEDQTPAVVVISASFTDPVTAETIRSIKERWTEVAVLVISSGAGHEELLWALKAGASGYVSLDSTGDQMIGAVCKVAEGELILCGVDRNSLTESPTEKRATDPNATRALGTLTPREREVLSLLSKGFSNRQIAENLFLSEHTVRTHVQNLRAKLNVRSKFQAAVLAMQADTSAIAGAGYRF